jgi:hypothetical protein
MKSEKKENTEKKENRKIGGPELIRGSAANANRAEHVSALYALRLNVCDVHRTP